MKHNIQVRNYQTGHNHYTESVFCLLETIKRKVWGEQIGNFNPIFCRYKGKRYLVHSEEGDLSDPFRREESYANSFFINL